MDISEETTPNSGSSPGDDETAEVSRQDDYNNDDDDDLDMINKKTTTKTIEATTNNDSSNSIMKAKYGVNVARTETNSHPLMLASPNGTDTEDTDDKARNPNFPDVVPRYHDVNNILDISTNTTTVTNTTTTKNKLQNDEQTGDLLSSESDADISPYHTAVEANFQTVALIPNNNNNNNIHSNSNNGHTYNDHNKSNHHHHHYHDNHKNFNNNHKNNYNTNSVNLKINRMQQLQQKQQQQRLILTGCEDISSLDSISNHSFDNEPNLASLSPSSSLMDIDALNDNENNPNKQHNPHDDDNDDGDDDDNDDDDDDQYVNGVDDDDYDDDNDVIDIMHMGLPKSLINRHNNKNSKSDNGLAASSASNISSNGGSAVDGNVMKLPQYSASEEQRDVRNWQKIILTNGTTHDIDMRVIEPYKRVLSHGGYLKAGGHNAIVLFCACHLPDRSRTDYSYVMDNLFLYVVKTLEQLVTEDYVLVYLHGGSDRRSIPPFPWLKKCYQLLDRRLRKSLKNLYLVHPTFWLKSIVWMTRPFVSTKFWRKLIYVKSLEELGTHVAIEKAAIPDKVKQYDAKYY